MIRRIFAAIILAAAFVAPAHADDRIVCETYATAVLYIATLQQHGYSAEQVRAFADLPDVIHPDWTDLILANIEVVYQHAPPPLPDHQREAFLFQFERNYLAACLAARGQ